MILGVTGHRPNKLGGYSREAELRSFAVKQLKTHAPISIITGMALGWDTAIAHAAILLRIPFTAAIPCDLQDALWPPQARRDYAFLLSRAADRVLVSPGPFTAAKMQTRNRYIVDHCDRLLACWNGTLGGTANCIQYARTINRPTINCFPEYRPI